MQDWRGCGSAWHTLSVARGYGRPDRCRPTFTVNALRPPYASASPAPPRALPAPAPPSRHAKYRHLDLHDPSGRSYETQLASLFRERQAFRLHLQLNLESIIRLVCTRIILCYSTIRITACCTHVEHHLLKNSFSSHCVFVLTSLFTTVFIELFVNKSREPF